MRKKNVCSESVFSLFLFAGYFQKSLTLFSKKDHHFKKILVPLSKQEATSHEWLQISEHSKDIESLGGYLLNIFFNLEYSFCHDFEWTLTKKNKNLLK